MLVFMLPSIYKYFGKAGLNCTRMGKHSSGRGLGGYLNQRLELGWHLFWS